MGFEETLCGKVGVQFLPVFGGKLLLSGFPADGSVFLVNLFVGSVVGDMGKGGVDGLYPAFRFSDVGFGRKYLPADLIQIGVKVLNAKLNKKKNKENSQNKRKSLIKVNE